MKARSFEKKDFCFNLRFPGQYYDSETGFYYNFHRYYSLERGRYLREDPKFRYVSYNYSYGKDNPISWIDYEGLSRIFFNDCSCEERKEIKKLYKKARDIGCSKLSSLSNIYPELKECALHFCEDTRTIMFNCKVECRTPLACACYEDKEIHWVRERVHMKGCVPKIPAIEIMFHELTHVLCGTNDYAGSALAPERLWDAWWAHPKRLTKMVFGHN